MPNTELLTKARATIPTTLGAHYLRHPQTGAYCALGYLAHVAGIEDNQITGRGSEVLEGDKLRSIDLLIGERYGITYYQADQLMEYNDRLLEINRPRFLAALLDFLQVPRTNAEFDTYSEACFQAIELGA